MFSRTFNRLCPLVLVALLVGLTVGCTPEGTMEVPTSFVDITRDYSVFDTRGLSADECVVGLRTYENQKNGSLAFWTSAIQAELKRRGYVFQGEKPLRIQSGQSGTLLQFTRREMSYWIGVIVTDDEIALPEAGGKAAEFTKRQGEILQAFQSVKL